MTTLPALIFYHCPCSPFAEKIRLTLGDTRMAWKPVVMAILSPKPDLVALTGGCRVTVGPA